LRDAVRTILQLKIDFNFNWAGGGDDEEGGVRVEKGARPQKFGRAQSLCVELFDARRFV
jgi:hypothetical protein